MVGSVTHVTDAVTDEICEKCMGNKVVTDVTDVTDGNLRRRAHERAHIRACTRAHDRGINSGFIRHIRHSDDLKQKSSVTDPSQHPSRPSRSAA